MVAYRAGLSTRGTSTPYSRPDLTNPEETFFFLTAHNTISNTDLSAMMTQFYTHCRATHGTDYARYVPTTRGSRDARGDVRQWCIQGTTHYCPPVPWMGWLQRGTTRTSA